MAFTGTGNYWGEFERGDGDDIAQRLKPVGGKVPRRWYAHWIQRPGGGDGGSRDRQRGGCHLPRGVGWLRRHWQTHGSCDVEWSVLMYARVFLRSYFMNRFFSHVILFGWRL